MRKGTCSEGWCCAGVKIDIASFQKLFEKKKKKKSAKLSCLFSFGECYLFIFLIYFFLGEKL